MVLERKVQERKEVPNQQELGDKSETELKNKNNKRRKEKRRIFKGNLMKIEEDTDKNCFFDYKNISGRDSDYKSKKGKRKNNNKRNRINKKRNIDLIITVIFINLIIPTNNRIENKFSNITLIIKGIGFSNIFYYEYINNNNRPNFIYINGNQNITITHNYYFTEINNTVNLIWNNPIDNCGNMFRECSNIIEIDLSNF